MLQFYYKNWFCLFNDKLGRIRNWIRIWIRNRNFLKIRIRKNKFGSTTLALGPFDGRLCTWRYGIDCFFWRIVTLRNNEASILELDIAEISTFFHFNTNIIKKVGNSWIAACRRQFQFFLFIKFASLSKKGTYRIWVLLFVFLNIIQGLIATFLFKWVIRYRYFPPLPTILFLTVWHWNIVHMFVPLFLELETDHRTKQVSEYQQWTRTWDNCLENKVSALLLVQSFRWETADAEGCIIPYHWLMFDRLPGWFLPWLVTCSPWKRSTLWWTGELQILPVLIDLKQ